MSPGVNGVAWSKQSAPDVLGDVPLSAVEDELDDFTLKAWVTHGEHEQLIQDGTLAQLLPPAYWVKELGDQLRPGTVLVSGTIPMIPGVDQFADAWRVELTDPDGLTSRIEYRVETLAPAWD